MLATERKPNAVAAVHAQGVNAREAPACIVNQTEQDDQKGPGTRKAATTPNPTAVVAIPWNHRSRH